MHPRRLNERARGAEKAIVFVILDARLEMAASAEQVGARRQAKLHRRIIAVTGNAGRDLIAEQRRTNSTLQTILYLCIGFVMASVVLQLLWHLELL